MTTKTTRKNAPVLFQNPHLGVWVAYMWTKDVLDRLRNRELKACGINLEYRGVLNAVKRQGMNATPGEIAKSRGRRPHTISQVIRNMEKEGLITRHKDLNRRNMVRIALTDKGAYAVNNTAVSDAFMDIFKTTLRPADMDHFARCMELLRNRAENRYAVEFNAAPYYESYRERVNGDDFWRVLRRANHTLSQIAAVISDVRQQGLLTGIQEIDGINLVRTALIQECFEPETLGKLSENLEILRNQADDKLTLENMVLEPEAAAGSDRDPSTGSALWRSLSRSHDLIIRIRDRELAQYGCSTQLASVLYAVSNLGDEATPGQIAKWRMRNLSTISHFLARMQQQDLVDTRRYAGGGKRSQVRLTPKGGELLEQATRAESIVQIFAAIPEAELALFRKHLRAIRARAIGELDLRERRNIHDLVLRY